MRRYDLDWLRVGVFALLIFYHVGMFFVPWGYHLKNNEIYDFLVLPMAFVNRWRLPILFVISGMGTYYALGKRSLGQFSGERIKRLLIPLVVGMLFIVPPQVYLERIVEGQFSGGYLDWWPSQAFIGVYPEGNISWHHLWFLPYLLIYSLLLAPLFVYLRRHPDNGFLGWLRRRVVHPTGWYLFLIPLYLCEAFLEPFFPSTHALIGDWFNLVNYAFLFFFGFCLISIQDQFWKSVERYRYWFLAMGILGFSLQVVFWRLIEDSVVVHFVEAFVAVFNMWSWILALFGWSAAYLNQSSRVLSYANQAVYPFYILHQTITLIIGYYIMDLAWGFWPKFSIMAAGTFGFSWLLYEFGIRRWNWIRPLFGVKTRMLLPNRKPQTSDKNLGREAVI